MASSASLEQKLQFLMESSKMLPIALGVEEILTQKTALVIPQLADWCRVDLVHEGSLVQVQAAPNLHTETTLDSRGVGNQVATTGVAEFYPRMQDESVAPPHAREWFRTAQRHGLTSSMVLPVILHEKVLAILSFAYAGPDRTYTPEDFAFMQDYCAHVSALLENAHLCNEMRKQDLSKDSFLATLSHELRNPLAPIKSMLELMKLKPHAHEYKHDVEVIEHQFDHLTKILIDLLEVNRYAHGKIHMELRRVNLITVMRNSIESAAIFFKKKNLQLDVSMPTHAIVVRADSTRLEQALMNVLHNAEKFTPVGGRISVTVTSDDEAAHITIRDNGVGMDSQTIEHIFEPSVRDDTTGRKTDGLGLGLLLVKGIVQLHNGTVKARSEGLGKGSEFTISLPVLQQRLL